MLWIILLDNLFTPSLVPKDKLSNAIALNSAVINGSRLIGPAVVEC